MYEKRDLLQELYLTCCRRSWGSEVSLGEKPEHQRSHQSDNLRSHLVQLPQGDCRVGGAGWGKGLWEYLQEDMPPSSYCLDSILPTLWWWPWDHRLSIGSAVRRKSWTLGRRAGNTTEESEGNLEPTVLSAVATSTHDDLHREMASA